MAVIKRLERLGEVWFWAKSKLSSCLILFWNQFEMFIATLRSSSTLWRVFKMKSISRLWCELFIENSDENVFNENSDKKNLIENSDEHHFNENSNELWVDLKQCHLSSAEHPLHCRIGAARQLKCKIIVKSVHWACCCIEAGGALPRKRRALLGLGWPACCPLADSQLSPVQIGDTGDGGSAAYIMVGWSGLENYCCDGWFSITSCCVWFLDAGMD